MMETIVQALLILSAVYAGAGVVAAALLHARGLRVIDPATAGTPLLFRMLITPGVIALWLALLRRWRSAARGGDRADTGVGVVRPVVLRRIHGLAARAMAVLGPVVLATAVLIRQSPPVSSAPIQLVEPAPLPHVLSAFPVAFSGQPLVLRLRGDGGDGLQAELQIGNKATEPLLALYWMPPTSTELGIESVYLGAVWGPGTRRYCLPPAANRGGTLALYSFAAAETLATCTLPPRAAHGDA